MNDVDSSPLAAVVSTQWLETANVYTTVTASATYSSYRFTHWSNDSYPAESYRDAWGRSLNPISFELLEETVCTAHYLPAIYDGDSDGVPDWFEIEYFGTLTNGAAYDGDGDGISLLQESTDGTHPLYGNTNLPGGVFWQDSESMVINLAGYLRYTVRSEPTGTVYQSAVVSTGTVVTTTNMTQTTFGFWTLDGVRQQDAWGAAYPQITFLMETNNREAVAYLFSGDTDGDGVADAFEQYYFGTLTNGAAYDGDGDGLSLSAECGSGTSPLYGNTNVPGGVFWQDSASVVVNLTGYPRYTVRSEPTGTVYQSAIVTNGTVITTTNMTQTTFGFWTLDGVRQQDAWGAAYPQITFLMETNNREAVAYLFSGDTDGDGVADAFEQYYFGTLTNGAAYDGDGDGQSLLAECGAGTSPLYGNTNQPGGVAWQDSGLVVVDLQLFDRIAYTLVNGVFTNFFSPVPTNATGARLGANTAPALGDWDGDGALDLFVGASGGVMRVYANSGSPTVFNLRDRTPNFTALAPAWTNVPNPAPALGDWNGDGKAELAVGGETNGIRLVSFTGGDPSPAVVVTNLFLTVAIPAGVATNLVPAFVPSATPNGRADLLVMLGNGTVNLYTNTGNAAAPYSAAGAMSNLLGGAAAGATGLSVADTDGDGRWDVLLSDNDGRIWDYRQQPNGSFDLKSKVFAGTHAGFANRLTIAAADVDGDGDVDVIGGFAEGGLVYLQNPRSNLMLSPPVASLLPGQSQTFSALNAQGGALWSLLQNRSGGNLHSASGVYTAGASAPAMDIIVATDGAGKKGLAYVNVLSPSAISNSTDKVVILAGRKAESDPLWPATDYLADYAFNSLRYRGYSREHIQYLSPVTNQDADGDGLANDIDLESTWTNAQTTFTNFVKGAGTLFVYLVDHGGTSGGNGYFRLNPNEMLSATNLDAWLDKVQDTYDTEVTILLDFCKAGAFAADLTYTGTARRTVIATCGTDESSYFVAGGLVSFSDAFFSGVLMGLDVSECYELAADTMSSYQTASLSGAVAGVTFGVESVVGQDIPQIYSVTPNLTLHGDESALLWADDVFSSYDIEKVWCLLVPPGHQSGGSDPVIDLPEIELTPGNGRYEAEVDGFGEAGIYKVLYYARDIWGGVSRPMSSYVMQSNFDERVVLVAAGATNGSGWTNVNALATLAYQTFRARWLFGESVFYMNSLVSQDVDQDGTNDVDALPTLENLASAITNWAKGADKLTVYLLGEGTNGALRMNATETLTATNLDLWVDAFQQSNADACVVMDFDGSGGFLPSLLSPEPAQRVTIAAGLQKNVHGNKGLVSFSQYFLSDIFSGYSVGDAFSHARNAIRSATGKAKQDAQLDDNRDGQSNSQDGDVADQWYIGSAFITGGENPVIAEINPDTWLKGESSLLLWASGITAMDGVSNAWCLVTGPDYDGLGDVPQASLAWNAASGRYEALYTNFTKMGAYACTFLVMDNGGQVSSPLQCQVLVSDVYEDDNDKTQAVALVVGQARRHNFHAGNDEDWGSFCVVSNYSYEIRTLQQGTNVDTVLDVYREQADGSLALAGHSSGSGLGTNVGEIVSLNLPTSGIYFARVSSGNTNAWGSDSEYDLDVRIPAAAGTVLVVGINGLTAGALPTGVTARLDTGESQVFNGALAVSFSKGDGAYTVSLTNVPAGWVCQGYDESQPVTVAGTASNLACATFVLVPIFRVEGGVKDGWTGERLSGADLQWTATSGRVAGQTVSWVSQSDGNFPTNVQLVTENWNLVVTQSGYSNGLTAVAGSALSAGAVTNVGWLTLAPVDANTNGMADNWETASFGVVTNVTADGDDDGDGLSNQQEYWLGTDPKDRASALKVDKVEQLTATNALTLTWPAVNGRTYRVLATNALGSGAWPAVGGPWTAAPGQTNMSWTDTNAASGAKFYRMEVVVP